MLNKSNNYCHHHVMKNKKLKQNAVRKLKVKNANAKKSRNKKLKKKFKRRQSIEGKLSFAKNVKQNLQL